MTSAKLNQIMLAVRDANLTVPQPVLRTMMVHAVMSAFVDEQEQVDSSDQEFEHEYYMLIKNNPEFGVLVALEGLEEMESREKKPQ